MFKGLLTCVRSHMCARKHMKAHANAATHTHTRTHTQARNSDIDTDTQMHGRPYARAHACTHTQTRTHTCACKRATQAPANAQRWPLAETALAPTFFAARQTQVCEAAMCHGAPVVVVKTERSLCDAPQWSLARLARVCIDVPVSGAAIAALDKPQSCKLQPQRRALMKRLKWPPTGTRT
jgi:hypothetical protein